MVKATEPIGEAVARSRQRLRYAARAARRAARQRHLREPSRDVWRWTQRKYRVRAVVLLLFNAALFAGLGCFAFWLRTGEYTPFFPETGTYLERLWQTFDPFHPDQVTLLDFLVYPIPVNQVPLMSLIFGLVLASLTAIPVLVSLLYRFPFSLIFVAIVGFVAVLPWLALVTTLCCFLARWKPLRFNFRYATALLSLLPLVGYYALATRKATTVAGLAPVDIAKLYVPWVLALLAACLVMGIVLLVARLVNDRPGAIAPSLAVMFAIPVLLFESKVGRDELYYRLLEHNWGPGSTAHFVDNVDAGPVLRRTAQARFDAREDKTLSLERIEELVRLEAPFSIRELLFEEKEDALAACDAFLTSYPESRYNPNALYIQGRAMDMRIDTEFFRRTLVIRHYDDFPAATSEPVWAALTSRYPAFPAASVGFIRLAELKTRAGQVAEAIELLDRMLGSFTTEPAAESRPSSPGDWQSLLGKQPAGTTLGVYLPAVLQEGRKLRELLANNRDPARRDEPLARLLSMDPHHPYYPHNLRNLLADIPRRYPGTPLLDNVELLVALTRTSQLERLRELQGFIERYAQEPTADALPRARYELGALYRADNLAEKAQEVFDQLIRAHPASSWAQEARRQLAVMGGSARTDADAGG